MKKICLFFVGLFCFGAVAAQVPYDTVTVVDPQNFTLANTIDTALVQVISRKAGLNRRINFQTIKSYSTPDITLAWLGIDIEDTTGIATTYRDFFVTDNEGEVWFVDNAGRARKLYDSAQFQDLTISDDTIYISDGNFAILPGIAGTTIDSISYYSDTLRIYEGGDTIPFKVEILGGLSDGDYGHIDVSGSGTVMTVDTAVIGPTQIASTAVTPGSYTRTSLTVDADGRITAANSGPSDADGNGIFDATNNLDTIRVDTVYLRDSLWVIGDGNQHLGIENSTFEIIGESGVAPNISWRIAQGQDGFTVRNSGYATLNYAGMSSDTTGTVYLENTLDGAPFGWGRNRVGFDTYIGDSTGLLVQLAGAYPTSGQVLVAGPDSLFRFADASVIGDGNGLITALPAGDVTINAEGNTLFTVSNELRFTSITPNKNSAYFYLTDSTYNTASNTNWQGIDLIGVPSVILAVTQGDSTDHILIKPEYISIKTDTLDATGVTTFLGFPTGTDTDNQNLTSSRDTILIDDGTDIRTPGPAFLRDSITGAALTVNLKRYNQAIVEIRMEACTSTTLTVTNPWSSTDIDATYPTFEGEAGVYTFHFLGISGTDNVTWPADFLDMNGTALGTDALTTGTAYTCYRNPVSAKYYCK